MNEPSYGVGGLHINTEWVKEENKDFDPYLWALKRVDKTLAELIDENDRVKTENAELKDIIHHLRSRLAQQDELEYELAYIQGELDEQAELAYDILRDIWANLCDYYEDTCEED